jgi:hypothetical protein
MFEKGGGVGFSHRDSRPSGLALNLEGFVL